MPWLPNVSLGSLGGFLLSWAAKHILDAVVVPPNKDKLAKRSSKKALERAKWLRNKHLADGLMLADERRLILELHRQQGISILNYIVWAGHGVALFIF